MQSMSMAKLTVFFHFYPVRVIFFIFGGYIITVLTFITS